MNAVVGGGGGGGQQGGTNGGAGGNSYIEIDGVNIVVAGGGGGGAKGNAEPGQINTSNSTNSGGAGGQGVDFPSDITLMSVNSGKEGTLSSGYYFIKKGNDGTGGKRDGSRSLAAGGGGFDPWGGAGGYGGRGSNPNNDFDTYSPGGTGQAGSVRIWWFTGYR